MKNYFYVEIAGSPYPFGKIVVVGGGAQVLLCLGYADSGHPVADEKSRGGWSWRLGGTDNHARHAHFRTCSHVLSGLKVTRPWLRTLCCVIVK
jgi:hypothetical protein